MTEKLDVVSLGPGGVEERLVGHEGGAGEVVGQRHARQRPRIVGRQQAIAGHPRERVGVCDEADLMGELKISAAPRRASESMRILRSG